MPRHAIPAQAVRIAKRNSGPTPVDFSPQAKRKLAAVTAKMLLGFGVTASDLPMPPDGLQMTPALNAALIKLRDASAAKRKHRDDNTGLYGARKTNPRTKAGRNIRDRGFELHRGVMSALDDLLAMIDPDSAEDL
jgi:hypothetical protein